MVVVVVCRLEEWLKVARGKKRVDENLLYFRGQLFDTQVNLVGSRKSGRYWYSHTLCKVTNRQTNKKLTRVNVHSELFFSWTHSPIYISWLLKILILYDYVLKRIFLAPKNLLTIGSSIVISENNKYSETSVFVCLFLVSIHFFPCIKRIQVILLTP
jgi:hypothetical protein